ncbi:hypothetical protein Ddc_15205 [Ditylenchus destructor]|nr:hypothetical protein Ddc_15205 [Ditylenchus destructor]
MPKLLRELSDVDDAIVAFGEIIPKSEIAQWFVNRGITLEERVQFRPLFTRIRSGGFLTEYYSDFAHICILGQAQQVKKLWFDQLFGKQYESVLFYAQFIPYREYSWPAMEQFLTFLFHPISYIKKVEMYTVNQIFVDAVKEKFAGKFCIPANMILPLKSNINKPPYIHCETFSLLFKSGIDVDGLCNALTWLERNVRAESIRIPYTVYTDSQSRTAVFRLLNNFVFGALRICAKRELRIHFEMEPSLLIGLVKIFPTLSRFESEIPTIVLESYSSDIVDQIERKFGPKVIYREVDSHGATFLYVFENGHNKMRISFYERPGDNRWTKKFDCYVKFYAA